MSRRSLPTIEEAIAILRRRRPTPAPRPPPPAARALGPMIRELDTKFGKGASGLQVRWREVVGEQVARRTEPVKIVRGRNGGPSALEIRVAGPAAAIVQHQAPEILARVNLFLGEGRVDKLRIVQGPLRRPIAEKLPPRRPPPLDAAQEAELAASVSGIADPALRASLMRLGRGVLRRAGAK